MTQIPIYIIVATTDRKILQNAFFQQLATSEKLQLIICNQQINDTENLLFNKPFTLVINTKTKGISVNRNIGLDAVKNTNAIAIIADDDVSYVEDFQEIIQRSVIENSNSELFRFKILSNEKSYKNYETNSFTLVGDSIQNRRKLLTFSSIEIAFKTEIIKKYQLKFNENFGIGSGKYIGGEEIFFLLDALQKGATIQYIPQFLVQHPFESSGKKYSEKLLQTFAVLYKRVFGFWAKIFILYFVLKKYKILKNNNISLQKAIKIMWIEL